MMIVIVIHIQTFVLRIWITKETVQLPLLKPLLSPLMEITLDNMHHLNLVSSTVDKHQEALVVVSEHQVDLGLKEDMGLQEDMELLEDVEVKEQLAIKVAMELREDVVEKEQWEIKAQLEDTEELEMLELLVDLVATELKDLAAAMVKANPKAVLHNTKTSTQGNSSALILTHLPRRVGAKNARLQLKSIVHCITLTQGLVAAKSARTR
jgi:hypothetical protein